MRRPESPDAWGALISGLVGMVGFVILIVGLATDSDWWLVGGALLFVSTLVSTVTVLRMQGRGRSDRQ